MDSEDLFLFQLWFPVLFPRGQVVPRYRDFLLEIEGIMTHLIDSNMLENIVDSLLSVQVKGFWSNSLPYCRTCQCKVITGRSNSVRIGKQHGSHEGDNSPRKCLFCMKLHDLYNLE